MWQIPEPCPNHCLPMLSFTVLLSLKSLQWTQTPATRSPLSVPSTGKSAWSNAPEFSAFCINLSQKRWLGYKAMLVNDPGQWPGHHCGQWEHWQQCLSDRTQALLSSTQALHAKHCSGPMTRLVQFSAASARALLYHHNKVYNCPKYCYI